MKKYTRVVASLLAMFTLAGMLPLANVNADEVDTTEPEVAIEEPVAEEESEDIVIEDDSEEVTDETEAPEVDETVAEEETAIDEEIIDEEVIDEEETTDEIIDEEVIDSEIDEEIPAEEEEVVPEEDYATGVAGFIDRIYSYALGRTPDASGRTYWVNQVRNGKTGADVARNFLFSSEFLNKGMTNSQFLDVLYRTFFDRASDPSGKQYYLNKLASGWTKQQVINAFINSNEWATVCLRYGIASGGSGKATITVTPNSAILNFVRRLYTTCLDRDAETSGLNFYANKLANHQMTGTDAAKAFFFSQELLNSDISNDEFIRRMYRTFYNREADESGFNYWHNKMINGMFREDVFNNFITAPEWKHLCVDNAILIGNPITVHHSAGASAADCSFDWQAPTDRGWHYVNSSSITCHIRTENNKPYSFYYRLYFCPTGSYTSELIYSSGVGQGALCTPKFDTAHGATLNVDGYLKSGQYTIYFYAADGTYVGCDYAEVESYDSGTYWVNKTSSFYLNTVRGWGWYYTTSSNLNYWNQPGSEVLSVRNARNAYIIATNLTSTSSTLYYRVYSYSNVTAMENAYNSNPINIPAYSGYVTPTQFTDGHYNYIFELPSNVDGGRYYIIYVSSSATDANNHNYICISPTYVAGY